MKRNHWLTIAAGSMIVLLLLAFPFLPGPYNRSVMGASAIIQFIGISCLLLLPFTLLWLIIEIRRSKIPEKASADKSGPYILAICCLILGTACYGIGSFFIYQQMGWLPALIVVLIGSTLVSASISGIRRIRSGNSRTMIPLPAYLVALPVMVVAGNLFLQEPLSAYSRNRMILSVDPLISQIEYYKNIHGEYPASLEALPQRATIASFMGINGIRYYRFGNRYAISFSQWKEFSSSEEIVLYDRSDLHKDISAYIPYTYSLDLHRVNYAYKTGDITGWKYFLCD